MGDSKVAKYFLIALLVIVAYLAVITVLPVLKSVILALIFAFAFYPVYKSIQRGVKSKSLAASIMILLLLLLIIFPGGLIVNSLVKQTHSAYTSIANADYTIPTFISERIDIDTYLDDILIRTRDFIVSEAPMFLGSIAELVISLFIFFFVIFYAFRDGDHWIRELKEKLPIKRSYVSHLISNTENITKAVIYGYLFTAIIQGTIGGLLFFFLGIPNPVFWGFLMTLLAAIPFLGTPIVFVPIALFELYMGSYFNGIFILAFGFIFLINIDNIIKPKIIGSKAKVHPALVMVGIFGGLSVFGFIGILLGPIILTMLFVIVKFFLLEFDV